ncbi:MAG: hypothetical protein NW206_00190 [Hyphomonadaceae bacterium]|nr:hypothetical protein [Hyphomonadaceae bacterium]
MEELPPPPPPWIETYQREHLTGGSALTTFQGLLHDELIVPQSALDAADPNVLANANIAFVNSMQDEALLLPGEFAQEALWSYFALDYVQRVAERGHVQYFQTRGEDELALKLAGQGLKSMIADPHLALFRQSLRLQQLEPKEAKKFAEKAGYRSVEEALRDFDRRLNELEQSEPLKARYKLWLKSLRKVRVVSDAEWQEALTRIASSNPLSAPRRAERARVEAELQNTDPTYLSVRALCDAAGLGFGGLEVLGAEPLQNSWPDGPKRQAFCISTSTSAGARMAAFFIDGGMFAKKYRAVLLAPGEGPVADQTLTAAEFEAVVPEGAI